MRDTGPYTASLRDGEWVGAYHGTHAPVVVWYLPEMLTWLRANRPVDERKAPAELEPIPRRRGDRQGNVSGTCVDVDPLKLLPTSGAAVMVRDRCPGCHGVLGQRQYAIDRTDTACEDNPFHENGFP